MNKSNRPGDYLTVEDRVSEEAGIARRAWLDGKQVGIIIGHEAGHIAGYAAGHHDGLRSTNTYKVAAQNEWISGYLTRISDEVSARSGGAA